MPPPVFYLHGVNSQLRYDFQIPTSNKCLLTISLGNLMDISSYLWLSPCSSPPNRSIFSLPHLHWWQFLLFRCPNQKSLSYLCSLFVIPHIQTAKNPISSSFKIYRESNQLFTSPPAVILVLIIISFLGYCIYQSPCFYLYPLWSILKEHSHSHLFRT